MQRTVPKETSDRAVQDLIKYKKEHDVSTMKLSQMVGVASSTMEYWMKGKYTPQITGISKLISAGITDVRLPELERQQAITKKLMEADEKNKVRKTYTKKVNVPDIIANQVKLLIDDYITQLSDSKTWAEFQVSRQELIRKLFYICRQGE